jgi:endo-alpha-1,4-polygalactosaminidase (GH114 family)
MKFRIKTDSTNVRNIMAARIKMAADKGCDGVDPDNVDGYNNNNGLDLTEDSAVDYISFLSSTAASHGLACGLKNAAEIIDRTKGMVQYSVNEQCHDYNECGLFSPFIDASKPVFNIEYPDSAPNTNEKVLASACATKSSNALGFSTIIKTMDLDGWVQQCDGAKATTATMSKRKMKN